MTLYRDEGVVIRTWRLGEADRIVVLLTRDNGKVRAVAKGVRKTRSKFGSRLDPTTHVALQLYTGRGELDIVTQVEAIDRFRNLRADVDRFADASSMLEAVDHLAPDHEPDARRYEMLVGALRTLDQEPSPLVVAGYFLKLLAHEGLRPFLDSCVSCGSSELLVAFDLGEGGALCGSCRRGQAISPEALEILRLIVGGRLRTALALPPSPALSEVDQLAARAMEYHLERRIRSRAGRDGLRPPDRIS